MNGGIWTHEPYPCDRLADRFRLRYHLPSDDLNQPLDFAAGAKTAKFDFLLGYITAEDDARPRWNAGDFFGKTFGNSK